MIGGMSVHEFVGTVATPIAQFLAFVAVLLLGLAVLGQINGR